MSEDIPESSDDSFDMGDISSLTRNMRMMDRRLQSVENQNKQFQEDIKRINEAMVLFREMMMAIAVATAIETGGATLAIAGVNLGMGSISSAIVVSETT